LFPMEIRELTHLDKVFMLEREMFKHAQVLLPLYHHFAPGIYMRELHIPAGVYTTGKIHKTTHWGMLLKGARYMATESGIITIRAPYKTKIERGSKAAFYTFEDSIWMTVHPNPDDETNIPKLEACYVCDTEQEYLQFIEANQIECHS